MSNEAIVSEGDHILITPAYMEIGKIYRASVNGVNMCYQLVEPNTVHAWEDRKGLLGFLCKLFRRTIDV